MVTASIVSHGHGSMVARLVNQFLALREVACIVVTLNVAEELDLPPDPRLRVIKNARPKGFAANHNAAFRLCESLYFCVVNPDVELPGNPLPALIEVLQDPGIAVAAPLVRRADGQVEDSWRRFPSPLTLALKLIGVHDGTYSQATRTRRFEPDWVAGMFLVFSSENFAAIGGFDEDFFLYYEDVDLCARLRLSGREVIGCSDVEVVHNARRASRRDARHLRFHLASACRYFARDWRRMFPPLLRRAGRRARALRVPDMA